MDFGKADSDLFDHSKLKGRIVEKYGTMKEFYSHLPYTPEMAFRKFKGKSGLSRTDILEWCEILDIPTEEIPAYFFALKV